MRPGRPIIPARALATLLGGAFLFASPPPAAARPPRAPAAPDLQHYVVYLDLPRAQPVSASSRVAGNVWAQVRRSEVARHAAPVLARLQGLEAAGRIADPQLLWIVRAVSVRVDPSLVPWIESLPGVRAVRPDLVLPDSADGWTGESGAAADSSPGNDGPNPAAPVAEALTEMNVDDVWPLGYTGQGVLVASVDTGVDHNHPDLADHIWVNPDEIPGDGTDNDSNGKIDDIRGWSFKLPESNDPVDDANHGTAVAGLALGDGTAGQQTGAAPDATLMILRRGNEQSTYWAALQYAIDEGADIIVQAQTWNWARSPRPDYAEWREATDAVLSAGVLMIVSSGNLGTQQATNPVPYNINAPANSPPPFLHAEQPGTSGGLSAVLAAANVDLESDRLSDLSGRGPSEWTDIQAFRDPAYPYPMPALYQDYPYAGGTYDGLLKPDLALYGTGSTAPYSSLPPGDGRRYGPFNGTSASAGHLAGIAALMLSARPGATPAQLARVLYETALDRAYPGWPPGWDPGLGSGLVDALAAVQAIGSFCELSGGDADGDAICQWQDNCPLFPNPTQRNRDGDGLGDACDACPGDASNDADDDGVCGDVDNCPAHANGGQENADGDALGDACDACPADPANDADADAVCGDLDNCPAAANPLQENSDLDPVGDACDCAPNNGGVFRAPGEASSEMRLVGRETLSWPPQPDAETYNLFRGTIAPGQPFANSYTCYQHGIIGDRTSDVAVPLDGHAFNYLLQAANCFGVGPLGADSNGTPRPSPAPCP